MKLTKEENADRSNLLTYFGRATSAPLPNVTTAKGSKLRCDIDELMDEFRAKCIERTQDCFGRIGETQ